MNRNGFDYFVGMGVCASKFDTSGDFPVGFFYLGRVATQETPTQIAKVRPGGLFRLHNAHENDKFHWVCVTNIYM